MTTTMRGRGYSHYHHDYDPRPNSHRLPLRRRTPPPPARPRPQQHTVLLKRPTFKDPKPLSSRAINDLIGTLPSPPKEPHVFPQGGFFGEKNIAARLFFTSRSDALDAVDFLWRRRLDGDHFLIPMILGVRGDPNLLTDQLQRVKQLLIGHVEFVMNSEIVSKCEKRVEELLREIEKKDRLLSRGNKMNIWTKLRAEKEKVEVELEHVSGKLEEFRIAMKSILHYLHEEKDRVLEKGEFDVFRFEKNLDLHGLVKVHSMVMRECRRLSDGLPIYACRRKILQTVFLNQVL